jgi:hypothetical protein
MGVLHMDKLLLYLIPDDTLRVYLDASKRVYFRDNARIFREYPGNSLRNRLIRELLIHPNRLPMINATVYVLVTLVSIFNSCNWGAWSCFTQLLAFLFFIANSILFPVVLWQAGSSTKERFTSIAIILVQSFGNKNIAIEKLNKASRKIKGFSRRKFWSLITIILLPISYVLLTNNRFFTALFAQDWITIWQLSAVGTLALIALLIVFIVWFLVVFAPLNWIRLTLKHLPSQ